MSDQIEKWIDYARYTLIFCWVCYVFLAFLGFPIAYLATLEDRTLSDDEKLLFIGILGGLLFVISIIIGVLNFAVSDGLKKRRKWAWIGGLILGILYVPSACLPFGGVILYAMIKNQTAFDPK